jgi:glutamate synthase domain-containing protein 3
MSLRARRLSMLDPWVIVFIALVSGCILVLVAKWCYVKGVETGVARCEKLVAKHQKEAEKDIPASSTPCVEKTEEKKDDWEYKSWSDMTHQERYLMARSSEYVSNLSHTLNGEMCLVTAMGGQAGYANKAMRENLNQIRVALVQDVMDNSLKEDEKKDERDSVAAGQDPGLVRDVPR